MHIDNIIKCSIARIVTEVINADGLIYETEIDCLNEYKKEHHLSTVNFIDCKKMSLADAINNVVNADKQSDGTNKFAHHLYELIENLAGIDGAVAPNEAMICLAFRYAMDFPDAHVFSFKHSKLRFSKKEVIYINSKTTPESEKLYEEIRDYYDNICSILGLYGFRFIWIPRIKEDFISLSKQRLRQIIEYLYPEKQSDEVIDNTYEAMMSVGTQRFSHHIMKEGAALGEFPPSLLFKISTSSVVTKSGRESFDNFLQLPIMKGYAIQQTIQNFTRKYIALLKENRNEVKTNCETKFNLHGFHKSFLDFSLALEESRTDVTLIIQRRGRKKDSRKIKKSVIRMGTHDMQVPLKALAYYLLMIFLCRNGKCRLKEMENKKEDDTWKMFCSYYQTIFSGLNMSRNLLECKWFSTEDHIDGSFYNIRDAIAKLERLKNAESYIPKYNKKSCEYTVSFSAPIKVNPDYDSQKVEEQDFMDWVNSLRTQYKQE